jgi:hypothetical protein
VATVLWLSLLLRSESLLKVSVLSGQPAAEFNSLVVVLSPCNQTFDLVTSL